MSTRRTGFQALVDRIFLASRNPIIGGMLQSAVCFLFFLTLAQMAFPLSCLVIGGVILFGIFLWHLYVEVYPVSEEPQHRLALQNARFRTFAYYRGRDYFWLGLGVELSSCIPTIANSDLVPLFHFGGGLFICWGLLSSILWRFQNGAGRSGEEAESENSVASPKSSLKNFPSLLHLPVWCLFTIFGFELLLTLFQVDWPPDYLDRQRQRRMVLERVRAAGGWEALRHDCAVLVEQHKDDYLQWYHGFTNELPNAITALRPQAVTFYPPGLLLDHGSNIPVVRIKIFGLHSTGGHSTPYYGLAIACGPEADKYRPSIGDSGGVSGNRHSSYMMITNAIFEIF